MFNGEIQAGRYYVGGNKGKYETFIRYVDWLNEQQGVLGWRDYGLRDGKSIGSGQCSTHAFTIWAIRPATKEEIGRCQQEPDLAEEMRQNRRMITESAAQIGLKDSTIISDEELEAELVRRRKARKARQAGSKSMGEERVNELAE